MSKEFLQLTLNRLLEIKEGFQIDDIDNICANLIWRIDNKERYVELNDHNIVNKWLYDQFQIWPECYVKEDGTKDLGYPVGGWDEYWDEKIQGTVWKNPRRLELLNFLIEQAKQQLNEIN